ncbi:hypothetical protein MED121_06710 [Marinomonas sp. MED121]|nr:hypothetical protein MED121_06710 [Marinomonas sp. MED121]
MIYRPKRIQTSRSEISIAGQGATNKDALWCTSCAKVRQLRSRCQIPQAKSICFTKPQQLIYLPFKGIEK